MAHKCDWSFLVSSNNLEKVKYCVWHPSKASLPGVKGQSRILPPPSKDDCPGSTVLPLRHPQPRWVLAFSLPVYVVVLKNMDLQMDLTILLSPVVELHTTLSSRLAWYF